MAPSSSSDFSSDDDQEIDVTMPHTHVVQVETINESEPSVVITSDADAAVPTQLVADCCLEITRPLVEDTSGSYTSSYEAFTGAILHLASHWPVATAVEGIEDEHVEVKIQEYRTLRSSLYESFHRVFPLTPEMYVEWISDVTSVRKKQNLYELAMEDYWSVPLALQYLRFLDDNKGNDSITKDTLVAAMSHAQQTVGLHFTLGHEVWQLCRELVTEQMDDSEDEVDNLAKEDALRDLYARQMEIPLQQNDLVMSEFRAWNTYNMLNPNAKLVFDAAFARQTNTFGPLIKKMNMFEERLQAAASGQGGDKAPLEQVWVEYLNFVNYRILPLISSEGDTPSSVTGEMVLTCFYERAIAMECLSSTLWAKYVGFVDQSPKKQGGSRKLSLCRRAVRNVSFDSSMWNELLLEMEILQYSITEITEFVMGKLLSRTNPIIMDQYHFLRILMAYCDIHRRYAAQNSGCGQADMKRLEEAFNVCEAFMETHFPDFPTGVTRLLEYHAKCCLLASAVDPGTKHMQWEALWMSILLKRSHEAEVWMTFYQECLRVGRKTTAELRANVFEEALKHVKDYPLSIAELFLVFERENGDLTSYLRACKIHRDLSSKAQSHATQVSLADTSSTVPTNESQKLTSRDKPSSTKNKRKANDQNDDTSKQHNTKRVKTNNATSNDDQQNLSRNTDPAEKKQQHDAFTNEHTLFVSNVSKDAGKEEVEAFFADIPGLKDVRLVVKARTNHVKSRGMAYVQFADEAGVEQGLSRNGCIFHDQPLSVERSKPTVPSKSNGVGKKTKDLGRDGTWKTNPITIYVGGLQSNDNPSPFISKKRLQEAIQNALLGAGETVVVTQAVILQGKRGKLKDYGLVELADPEQAQKCFARVSEIKQILGENVTLKPSRFSIDEILEQQQATKGDRRQKTSQPVKKQTKLKLKKHTLPDAVPHEKPSTRVAIPSTKTTTTTTSAALMPRALRKKSTASPALEASQSSTPKTNEDFRKMLLKQ